MCVGGELRRHVQAARRGVCMYVCFRIDKLKSLPIEWEGEKTEIIVGRKGIGKGGKEEDSSAGVLK